MLGWNPGNDEELFTMEKLINTFSLERVIKSGAKFNPEKSKWYNKEYLREKSDDELTKLFIPVLKEKGIEVVDNDTIDFENKKFSYNYVLNIVGQIKERASFVAEFWDLSAYLFQAPSVYVEKDMAKFWKEENYTLAFKAAEFVLSIEGDFTKENIEEPLHNFIKDNEMPMGKVMNCLRLIIVGASSGLGIADMMALIGRNEFSKRVENIKSI